MAWNAPMTAAANTIWFASQFNRFIRDNLNETAPALATAEGQYFVSNQDAQNSLRARQALVSNITTSQTTTSTSYTSLATTGPKIIAKTGTTAAVFIAAEMSNSTANAACHISFALTDCTFIPASDLWGGIVDGKGANQPERVMAFSWEHNLNPGDNAFTMQYKVSAGTGTFLRRTMVVMPLS